MKNTRPFYLKQWRQHRDLTQQMLADRLDTSKGYISELERGKRRYNQDLLEALADALMCEPADLLIRNPTDPQGIWTIWDQVPDRRKPEVIQMLTIIAGGKTGTTG